MFLHCRTTPCCNVVRHIIWVVSGVDCCYNVSLNASLDGTMPAKRDCRLNVAAACVCMVRAVFVQVAQALLQHTSSCQLILERQFQKPSSACAVHIKPAATMHTHFCVDDGAVPP